MQYEVENIIDTLSGPLPSWRRPWRCIDWALHRKALKKFFGKSETLDFAEREGEFKYLWLRCVDCKKLRTLARRMAGKNCPCGSNQLGPYHKKIDTRTILSALVAGR